MWVIRLIGVLLISLGIIRIGRSYKASSSICINFALKAGLGKSAIILAFAWALLFVAFVGVFTLPTLILEGVAGAFILLFILYFIGKKK